MSQLIAKSTPETREEAAVNLEKAAQWLEDNHWTQNYAAIGADGYSMKDVIDVTYLQGRHGGVKACCAAGVIALTCGEANDKYGLARDAVVKTLPPTTNTDIWGNGLSMWNDTEGRTKDEVVFALRAGADYLRAFTGGPQE